MSDDLAERLERVESRLAIGQLPIRYAMAIDARDVDTWVSLFIPDVQVGRDVFGHDALRAQIDPLLRTFGRSVHQICGHRIELDDADTDRATGATYCRAEHEVDDRWIVMAICYFDDYQRVDGCVALPPSARTALVRRRRQRAPAVGRLRQLARRHPRAARRVPDLGRFLARSELSYASASKGASCVQSVCTCCAQRSSDIAPIDTQKNTVSTGAPAVRVRTICATSSGVP